MHGEIKKTLGGEQNFTFLPALFCFRFAANFLWVGVFKIAFRPLDFCPLSFSSWSWCNDLASTNGTKILELRRGLVVTVWTVLSWGWSGPHGNSPARDEMFRNFASFVMIGFCLSRQVPLDPFTDFSGIINEPFNPTPLEWTNKPEFKALIMADFTICEVITFVPFSILPSTYLTIVCLDAPWPFPLANILTASITLGT